MPNPTDEITSFLAAWTVAERRHDVAFLDRHLTDDFVGVGPLGFTLPREAWFARHQPGELTYDNLALDELDIRVHGDAAVVVARQVGKGTYKGHPVPEAVRATLVLVQETGGWRLASVHFSFIAGTPGAPPLPGPGPAPQEGAPS